MAPSGRRLRMLCLLAVAVGLSTGPAHSPAPAEGQGGGENSRSVHADEPGSGIIAGVVLDLEGKPVPAALVVVCDDETGIPIGRSTSRPIMESQEGAGLALPAFEITDAGGRFSCGPLKPGVYRVIAQSWKDLDLSGAREERALAQLLGLNGVRRPGRLVELRGVADHISVPSSAAEALQLRPLGTGALHIDEQAPNDDAFLLLSTAPTRFDPALGHLGWGDKFVRHIIGGNRMPSGETTVHGLPAGKVYLAIFAADSAPGFGAGVANIKAGATTEVYVPLVATWSNARHEAPEGLKPLCRQVMEGAVSIAELLGDVTFNMANLSGLGDVIQRVGPLEREIPLPDGRQATVADLLAAYRYVELQRRATERLRQHQAPGLKPEWVASDSPAGDSSHALQFDGVSGFVKIPSSPSLDVRGSLTLSAWVKNDGDDDGQIIWRGDTQGGRDPYELHLKASHMEFRVDAGPGNVRDTSYTIQSKGPVDGRWHFWTAVYDKEAGKISLYKDAERESSADIHHDIEYDTSSMWNMIGAVDRGEWQHFRGSIDEVRVWNVARSAEEIRRDMKRTLTGEEPGLVACWTFDEGAGLIVHDSSPHGNHGYRGVWATGRGAPLSAASPVTYEEAFRDLYETLGREYPCFELKGIDWPQVGEELLPRARSVERDEAFGLLCLELVARLEDSHAYVQKGSAAPPWPPMPQWDPGFACLIDDRGKPVVYYVDKGGPAQRAGVRVGMTVLSVNGRCGEEAVEERMKQVSKYVGYSSRRYLRYQAARWFLRQMERGAMVALLLQEPDGRTHEFELPATLGVRYLPRLPVPVEGIADAGNVSWKMLEEDIGYIYVRRIRGDLIEKLDRAVAELKDARGLVLDVRGNSGGGFDARRAHRNFDPESDEESQRPRFGGRMALLIDARCISAGEGWASWFIARRRARVFGEATAGASSRKRTYTLKNGLYRVTFPVKAYRGFLDRPIERRGLEPDVPLRQNAHDLAAGRDTVLEAAKQHLLEME